MIIDNELVFSEELALTASANATGKEVTGMGLESKQAKLRLLVTTAGAGTGTVTLKAQGSSDDSTYVDLELSAAVVGTALTKGKTIKVTIPPNDYKYLRAAVVVSGTVTGAKGFIVKPISLEKLKKEITKIISFLETA